MYIEYIYICKYEKVFMREINIDFLKILGNVFLRLYGYEYV